MKALKKNPEADLRLKYRKTLEAGIAISLFVLTLMFFSFQKYESGITLPEQPKLEIEVIEIPPTEQVQKPPPPSRPSIPVEAEDDEILDDVSIEEMFFDNWEVSETPPPPPEEDEVFEFFAVSEKPELIYQAPIVYPDLARKAGIEGRVTVQVTISEKGDVLDAKIMRSIPMLDEAALEAAKKCKFKPAKQRDRFVKVKMAIPFDFKLKN